jgi:hypothetical protein
MRTVRRVWGGEIAGTTGCSAIRSVTTGASDGALIGPAGRIEADARPRRLGTREENASSQTSSSIRMRLAATDADVRAIVNLPLSKADGVS